MTTATQPVAQLTVRREIAATPEELFDAFLDAESLAEFMRPDSDRKSDVTNDPRVGGAFEIIMHTNKNGDVRHTGHYKVVDRPNKLVYTWNSPSAGQTDSLVTVLFQAIEGQKARTEVILSHALLPDSQVKGHTGGWTRIIELLEEKHRNALT
ncbi:MAG: SRPBCC family protein [Gemmatimonas sp.]